MVKKVRKGSRAKKERKNIPSGIIHIQSTFNNTIITITDPGRVSRALGRAPRSPLS